MGEKTSKQILYSDEHCWSLYICNVIQYYSITVKQLQEPNFLDCQHYSVCTAGRHVYRRLCSILFFLFSCCVLFHCSATSVGNCFLSVRTFIADAVNLPARFTFTKADWKTPGACCSLGTQELFLFVFRFLHKLLWCYLKYVFGNSVFSFEISSWKTAKKINPKHWDAQWDANLKLDKADTALFVSDALWWIHQPPRVSFQVHCLQFLTLTGFACQHYARLTKFTLDL